MTDLPPNHWPLRPLGFAWWVVPLVPMLVIAAGLLPLPDAIAATGAGGIVQFTIVALLALALARLGAGRLDRDVLGLQPVPFARAAMVAAAGLAAFYAISRLASPRPDPGAAAAHAEAMYPMLGIGTDLASSLALILAATVMAPLAEELAFRGVVFRGLRDGLTRGGLLRRHGATGLPGWLAVCIGAFVSALFFALMHGGEGQDGLFPVYLAAGLVLALAYHLTGHIAVPVTIHAAVNAISWLELAATPGAPTLAMPWLPFLAAAGPLLAVTLILGLGRLLPTAARS